MKECKIVEGTNCNGVKTVTKCSEALVNRCEEVTIPCGDKEAIADCELDEVSCADVG